MRNTVMSGYKDHFMLDEINQDAGCAQLKWEHPKDVESGKGVFRMHYNESKLKVAHKKQDYLK